MPNYFFSLLILLLPFFAVAQNSKAKEWEVEADTLMQRENFKEALKLYTKCIDASQLKSPQDFSALYKRGVAYYRLAEYSSALKDIDQLLAKNPQIVQGYILRAFIYRETKEMTKELESIQSALELTQDPGLMKWRASLLLQNGSYSEAKRDLLFLRGLQTDPETETQLGFIYQAQDDPDSAIMCINKAIELEPSYLPAYFYAGSLCLQEEAYEMGLKYVDLGLRLEPQNATLLMYKGIALVELKNLDEGCRMLRKSLAAGEKEAQDYLVQYCYK